MARKFVITDPDNEWVFQDQYSRFPGYISYRHVIEHALFDLIQDGIPAEEIKAAFMDLKKNYDTGDDIANNKIKIKIYFFKENNKAALVDDTKWCFPLICYLEKRGDGLSWAIKNIGDELDHIVDKLGEFKKGRWDKNLQDEMNKFDSRNSFSQAA